VQCHEMGPTQHVAGFAASADLPLGPSSEDYYYNLKKSLHIHNEMKVYSREHMVISVVTLLTLNIFRLNPSYA
jgi:hypothetical protein